MKIHLISYASNCFLDRKPHFIDEVKQFSKIDKWKIYGLEDLDRNFREKHKDILQLKRGGGYWIWKPYIINDYLKTMPQGDILFYVDIGCTLNNSGAAYKHFERFINLVKKHEVLTFSTYHYEYIYSSSTFIDYIAKKYLDSAAKLFSHLMSYQILSGVMGFKKGKTTMNYISECLKVLGDNPMLFTDSYNKIQPHTHFREHRHDQSTFSLVFKCLAIGVVLESKELSIYQDSPIVTTRNKTASRIKLKKTFFGYLEMIIRNIIGKIARGLLRF